MYGAKAGGGMTKLQKAAAESVASSFILLEESKEKEQTLSLRLRLISNRAHCV